MEDVASVWQKLVAAAEDGNIATKSNVDQVNDALVRQTVLMQ